jgi:drug/metabolite transporter (DMT)-like permease
MIIEFSFNRKLLYLLIYPISIQISKVIRDLYIKKDNSLFRIFRLFLGYEFSIIFLIISYYRTKSKSKKNNDNPEPDSKDFDDNNQIDIALKISRRKKKIKNNILLILLSLTNIGSYFFNYFAGNRDLKLSRNTLGIVLEIIFLFILTPIFLKEKYYKHHYLAVLIMIISLMALFFNYFFQIDDKSKYSNIFWYFPIYCFSFAIYDVLLKKYLEISFNSIYFVQLIIGTICCFPLLIYDIIAYNLNEEKSGVIIGFQANINDIKDFFLFLADIILGFFYAVGIMLTIYQFSPFYFIISEFFSELLYYYISLIKYYGFGKTTSFDFQYKTNNIIIFSLVFFINLINSLIFNEIIILKFCNLEYYTENYIKTRSTIDVSALFLDGDKEEESETEQKDNKCDVFGVN